MELGKKEIELLKGLVDRKFKAVEWVLENKEPKNRDKLEVYKDDLKNLSLKLVVI